MDIKYLFILICNYENITDVPMLNKCLTFSYSSKEKALDKLNSAFEKYYKKMQQAITDRNNGDFKESDITVIKNEYRFILTDLMHLTVEAEIRILADDI